MALNKKFFFIGTLIVLIGAVALFATIQAQRGASVTYQTVPIDKGRIEAKVTATGSLSALVTVQVGSQVSGRIQQLMVDFNSPVKKGEVLARLDPQLLDAALAQAQANDVLAKSNLLKNQVQAQDAERQFRRSEQLFSGKLIAQADRDTSQATADAARAQVNSAVAGVAQAQAGLHQAQVNLAYATIVSPIDGVVISRNIDVGQTVAASFQAPTLFVIAQDLRKLQVDASVAEADVGKLAPHLSAQFTVDAFPSEIFTGVVRQIRNAPQTLQNVVTYDAIIDVNNPKLHLRPGMTANVTFTYAYRDGALRVPNTALRFRPPLESATGTPTRKPGRKHLNQDIRTVWVLKDNKPQGVPIHTGLSDGTFTEVVSGKLQAGDRVITDSTDAQQGQASNTTTPPRMRGL